MKTDSISNQLRWVILLLAAAVILPTVCLLWFMNQAVKNERLAFRQKLIEIYEKKATTLFVNHSNELWEKLHQNIIDANTLPAPAWQTLMFSPSDVAPDGCLVYDNEGNLTYPVITDTHQKTPESIEHIWQMEFTGNNFEDSLKEYIQIADNAKTESLRYSANMAMARCLLKLDKHEAAKLLYQNIAYPKTELANNVQDIVYVMYSRIMLAELYVKTSDPNLPLHLSLSLKDLAESEENTIFLTLPSDTKIWALSKLIEIARNAKLGESLTLEIEKAQTAISKEEYSLQAAELFPSIDSIKDWPQATLRKLESKCSCLYGIYFKIADKAILCIFHREKLTSLFEDAIKDIEESSAKCAIYDNKGELAFCTDILGERFLSLPMGTYMPDWDITLYFDPGFLLNAPIKQAAYYTWIGVFAIIIISIIGITAIQVVSKQMKLNRLKNDFIATVTHELKTPLSSMRLLVDTLLEKRYDNESTAAEYLQLVANENKRLTHLIDSFLTFSRMERNKQVFDFQPVAPSEIAAAAVEAIQAKFQSSSGIPSTSSGQVLPESQTAPRQKNHCEFSATVADNLPLVNADKDAMVTVLVNLLDNAYKYTNADKHIKLNIYSQNVILRKPLALSAAEGGAKNLFKRKIPKNRFLIPIKSRFGMTSAQNGYVCFAVTDNGIGIPRRVQKRIFNRFYQVDSRLSRSVEGCGLGLSIVKFIVDAHKGKIEVESKLNQGSTFTVKLPANGTRASSPR